MLLQEYVVMVYSIIYTYVNYFLVKILKRKRSIQHRNGKKRVIYKTFRHKYIYIYNY